MYADDPEYSGKDLPACERLRRVKRCRLIADFRRPAAFLAGIGLVLATALAVVASPSESSPEVRQKTFEIVWSTIAKKYYDPEFGGVDWKKVRERYAPQVAAV